MSRDSQRRHGFQVGPKRGWVARWISEGLLVFPYKFTLDFFCSEVEVLTSWPPECASDFLGDDGYVGHMGLPRRPSTCRPNGLKNLLLPLIVKVIVGKLQKCRTSIMVYIYRYNTPTDIWLSSLARDDEFPCLHTTYVHIMYRYINDIYLRRDSTAFLAPYALHSWISARWVQVRWDAGKCQATTYARRGCEAQRLGMSQKARIRWNPAVFFRKINHFHWIFFWELAIPCHKFSEMSGKCQC